MADSSNVIPIKPPGPPAAPPPRKSRARKASSRIADDDVGYMLGVHQARVYEARAVALTVADALRELRGVDVAVLERLIRAADAVDRLLRPVAGLDDEEHLRQEGKAEREDFALSRM